MVLVEKIDLRFGLVVAAAEDHSATPGMVSGPDSAVCLGGAGDEVVCHVQAKPAIRIWGVRWEDGFPDARALTIGADEKVVCACCVVGEVGKHLLVVLLEALDCDPEPVLHFVHRGVVEDAHQVPAHDFVF